MPLRKISVRKGVTGEQSIELSANSIGNRKPKCTDHGYCVAGSDGKWPDADNYKYQIPCDGDWDCVFYNGTKNSGNLVQGACRTFLTGDDPDPEGFGNIINQGCSAKYYEFYLNLVNAGTYKPAVQVLDNWGWCNGECDSAAYPTGYKNIGCYQDGDAFEHCDAVPGGTINPWINYGGNVTVK